MRFLDKYRDPAQAAPVRDGDQPVGDPAVDADGDLRRSDARDRQVRYRPAPSRYRPAGARSRLPGVRDPRGADRQGGGDSRPPGGDLLLLRRHVAGPRQRIRPAVRQGARRRRAHSLLTTGRRRDRRRQPRPPGGVLRGGLRDHGAGQCACRPSRPERGHRQLLDAGLARAGAAGHGGDSGIARQSGAGVSGCRPRLHGDGVS